MRKTLAAVVALALTALVLASCSSKPSTSAGPAAAPATVSTSTPTAPAATIRAAARAAGGGTTASRQASGTASKSRPVVLADGRHPVFVTRVNASTRTLTFDLIQFLTGDDAIRAAAEDHQESPPPNDYYIRNVNPRLRTLPVRPGAPVTVNTLAWNETGSSTTTVPVSLAKLADLLPQAWSPPFWVTVRNGQVVRIAEQFVP